MFGERRHHVHAVAGSLQQHCLDEVVAHDMAAEGLAARKIGEARRSCEGRGANDGVMAPIVALVAMPEGQTCSDRRSVRIAGELLQPLQQRFTTDESWHGLDQACLGISIDSKRQRHQRCAGHYTIPV